MRIKTYQAYSDVYDVLKDWNIFGLICLSGSGSKSTLKSLHSKPHLVQRPNSDLHNIIANSKLSVDRSMDGQGWGNNRIGFGGVGWDGKLVCMKNISII